MNFSELRNHDDFVALHEVGHFVVMYALGLYDNFTSITIEHGVGTEGLTEGNFPELQEYPLKFVDLQQRMGDSADDFARLSNHWFVQSWHTFFPHICRLFAGGAITRFYGLPADELCSIDNTLLKGFLPLLGAADDVSFGCMQKVVDDFLVNVFRSYEDLTQIVFAALKQKRTIDKVSMDFYIEMWKNARFGG